MGRRRDLREGISLQHTVLQLALMCPLLYLWTSPFVQPLRLMVVLFHEMSHGFVALITGGKVLSILITADEGGACETEGGIAALIVSAGYVGSMMLGASMLYLSRLRQAVPVVYGMLTLILVSAVATVLHDSLSRTLASGLAAAFIFLGFLLPAVVGSLALRALGTFCCLYSLADIYSDVLAKGEGGVAQNDATALSELTGVAEQTAGMAWIAISAVMFFMALKGSLKGGTGVEEDVQGALETR